jgi:hypothetical protein
MKSCHYCGFGDGIFCVEKFGTTRLREIGRQDIDSRLQQFKDLVNFEIELAEEKYD